MRIFGPWMSARIPIARMRSSAARRIFCTRRRKSSSDPWLKLIRATDMPASISSPTRSSLAGPIVATILVWGVAAGPARGGAERYGSSVMVVCKL